MIHILTDQEREDLIAARLREIDERLLELRWAVSEYRAGPGGSSAEEHLDYLTTPQACLAIWHTYVTTTEILESLERGFAPPLLTPSPRTAEWLEVRRTMHEHGLVP